MDNILDDQEVVVFMSKPFSVMGGSAGQTWRRFVKLMPEHKRYVELFGGSGDKLFWNKEPSEEEILNDIDPMPAFMLNFIRHASTETVNVLKRYNWNPSKALFDQIKTSAPKSAIEKFRRYVYVKHFGVFNASIEKASYANWYNDEGPIKIERKFDPKIQQRLKNVTLSQLDFRKAIDKYDGVNTFFYLDPPFADTNTISGSYYKNSLTKEDFQEMANKLSKIKGKFLLTFYGSKEIMDMFRHKGFTENVYHYPMRMRVGSQTNKDNYSAFKKNYCFTNFSVKSFSEDEEGNVEDNFDDIDVDDIEKFVENLKSYDPTKVSEQVLQDDYRILLAGWSSDSFEEKNKHLVCEKFKEVLAEVLKRGGTVLKPSQYQAKAKELFYSTLKELVKAGVYLVDPHAKNLATGKKQMIVKAREFDNMLGKPLLFGDSEFIYGVVILR